MSGGGLCQLSNFLLKNHVEVLYDVTGMTDVEVEVEEIGN